MILSPRRVLTWSSRTITLRYFLEVSFLSYASCCETSHIRVCCLAGMLTNDSVFSFVSRPVFTLIHVPLVFCRSEGFFFSSFLLPLLMISIYISSRQYRGLQTSITLSVMLMYPAASCVCFLPASPLAYVFPGFSHCTFAFNHVIFHIHELLYVPYILLSFVCSGLGVACGVAGISLALTRGSEVMVMATSIHASPRFEIFPSATLGPYAISLLSGPLNPGEWVFSYIFTDLVASQFPRPIGFYSWPLPATRPVASL